MQRKPHRLIAIFIALTLALLASNTALDGQTLHIDSSTANWIEGFADFVRWDETENSESITVGVIAAPEVANYLTRRANDRASKPSISVVKLSPSDSLNGIDIVFVGGSNRKHWPDIVRKCSNNKTLSIGLQDGFVEAGGCVEFVVRRNRLRFYIDQGNARRCGIVVSSKLLELAIEPKR